MKQVELSNRTLNAIAIFNNKNLYLRAILLWKRVLVFNNFKQQLIFIFKKWFVFNKMAAPLYFDLRSNFFVFNKSTPFYFFPGGTSLLTVC